MGEYYLLTKDRSLLPAIESLNRCLVLGQTPESGGYSHKPFPYIQQRIAAGGPKGYGAMALPGGLAMVAMSLFKEAGLDHAAPAYDRLHQAFLRSVGPNGAIDYGFKGLDHGPDGDRLREKLQRTARRPRVHPHARPLGQPRCRPRQREGLSGIHGRHQVVVHHGRDARRRLGRDARPRLRFHRSRLRHARFPVRLRRPDPFGEGKFRLVKVASDAHLTFQPDSAGEPLVVLFSDLAESDRALLSRLVARLNPTSGEAQILAGIQMELAGETTLADDYYRQAGQAFKPMLDALFE